MSNGNEDVSGGGLKGPSEAVDGGSNAITEIARHLAVRAITLGGELTPSAATQMALRDDAERSKAIDEFVLSLAPDRVDVGQLVQWLDGGPSPFRKEGKKKGVQKVGTEGEWPSQTLMRCSPRVNRQRKKVAAVEAQLEEEKRKLAYAEAHEKASIQWFVTDHLIDLISPVFAMGPAWTIMRSVSGHLPEAVGDAATSFLFGKEKERALKQVRVERQEDTDRMLRTLDDFSGIVEFEEEMRTAVMAVCNKFEGQREKLITDGRRARGEERFRAEVHPKARADAAEILDGLKRAS